MLFFKLFLTLRVGTLSIFFTVLWAVCATRRPCLCVTTKHCSLSLSFWVDGCAVCGVTIAKSNVSRMDPNHKMLSSQHVSPPGQGEISESLRSTGLVSLKNHWLGNTCTVRIMNVPLFSTFLCCKTSAWIKMSVRHLILICYWFIVVLLLHCMNVYSQQWWLTGDSEWLLQCKFHIC